MKFLNPKIENSLYKKEEIFNAIKKVIDSDIFINGPQVEHFEREIEKYLKIKHCITTNSGTDSLYLILKALGIEENDEIITTPFTFIATAEAIANVGAIPVFVDINPETFNIDCKKIEEAITENTKAILPVHLFGKMADMKAILKIAKKYKLLVIEDVAQAFGTKQNGKFAGIFGFAGAFSFYPTKNLAAIGDGGMIVTNNTQLAKKIKKLKEHGFIYKDKRNLNIFLGINSRLDEIQAAVLRIKLKHFNKILKLRKEKAKYYCDKLNLPFDNSCTYNQFTIRLKNKNKLNFTYKIYYQIPLHLEKAFEYLGYKKGELPEAEKVAKEVISLPLMVSQKEQDKVIKKIKLCQNTQ